MLTKSFKDYVYMFSVLGLVLGVDKDVVEVNDAEHVY